MNSELKISDSLALPAEAVTQTFAILAQRGMGKTYTAKVMTEEMIKAQLQVVVVDPIGVWWGLRSSSDGKSEGLPIIIAGGEHADIPLQPDSGAVIAELIVANRLSVVIDISMFRKNQQHKFMVDFAETLYHKNREALHLVLDEADEFAPQRAIGDEARMLGAIEDLVRRGRARGIGVTMITQRPAVLNKNVLTQISVLVALRLTAPQDRAAISDWVKFHADASQSQEMLQSLASLPRGTAWLWSPGWMELFKKIEVRRLETFDSSATPAVGETRVDAHMAKVDLASLTQQLEASFAAVAENDPKVLKRRIKELEMQMKDIKPQVEMHRVEVLPAELRAKIKAAHSQAIKAVEMTTEVIECIGRLTDANGAVSHPSKDNHEVVQRPSLSEEREMLQRSSQGKDTVLVQAEPVKPVKNLGVGEEKILIAVGQFDHGTTRRHLTVLTGYKRSTRNTYITRLAIKGYIKVNGDNLTITPEGMSALGDKYETLPTGAALREKLLNELPTGERSILSMLLAAYPESVSREVIGERTGYARSSRNTYIVRMAAREIIEVNGQLLRAADNLFDKEES